MPPFRIPFTSRRSVPNGVDVNDENVKPASTDGHKNSPYQSGKPSLALGVKERKQEPNEFKLSAVDDKGQYLPPSPTEKTSFWSKSPSATSNHRSLISSSEPFSISRESFESYRRSFDISGRSPITHQDSYHSRSSLDSRTFYLGRPAINGNTFERPDTVRDEDFEDVKLSDEVSKQQPKKKSFLSRFSDTNGEPNPEHKHHFHLPGRKRGQSASGQELGEVQRPASKGTSEVPVQ